MCIREASTMGKFNTKKKVTECECDWGEAGWNRRSQGSECCLPDVVAVFSQGHGEDARKPSQAAVAALSTSCLSTVHRIAGFDFDVHTTTLFYLIPVLPT